MSRKRSYTPIEREEVGGPTNRRRVVGPTEENMDEASSSVSDRVLLSTGYDFFPFLG